MKRYLPKDGNDRKTQKVPVAAINCKLPQIQNWCHPRRGSATVTESIPASAGWTLYPMSQDGRH